MLIKSADDKSALIAALQQKAEDPHASPAARAQAAKDLLFVKAGARAEKDAAYEIDFHYAARTGWAVVHDLRIEVDGRVAQIDHIIINRLLQVFVLETKSFSEGVGLNDHGEFVQFYKGRPQGIASPVAQNERHILVLNSLFKSGAVPIPTRMGLPITPACVGLVVVSKTARISRPKEARPETQALLKIDQLSERLDKEFDKGSMLRVVSSDTLREFASALANQHKPAPLRAEPIASPPRSAPPAAPAEQPPSASPDPAQATTAEPKAKLVCADCGTDVPYTVAKFCWMNKNRFGGKVYCREHQK